MSDAGHETAQRARRLLTRPGGWIEAAPDGYAVRVGRDRRLRVLLTVDEAVFRIIRSVTDGTWKGGLNATFGLAEHGVGLGKLNADVPQEHRSMLEDVQRKILAGEIEIPESL